MGYIPGLGRHPRGGNCNPVWYSCLEEPMDRGVWWVTVHGVTKSQTQLCIQAQEMCITGKNNDFPAKSRNVGREQGVNAAPGRSWKSRLSHQEEGCCFLPGKPEQASALLPSNPGTHSSANGTWWLARELTSSCPQVTGREDNQCIVERFSESESLHSEEERQYRALSRQGPAWLGRPQWVP